MNPQFDEHGRVTKEYARWRLRNNFRDLKLRIRARILHLLTFGLAEGIWY
jgi:hypothetical protein